ncbi:GDSL-like protein [Micrococcus luteus SK58]|nr:GDSL-like protein [Micrococcus luteus SK58]
MWDMSKTVRAVLAVSLLLNLVLLAAAGVWVSKRVWPAPPERPNYSGMAQEFMTGLPGAEVALVGDSHIAGGAWSEVLGMPVAARGQSGARIAELDGAVDALPHDAREVVVWAGTNDVIAGHDVAQVEADMEAMLAKVEAVAPAASVIVLSVPPLNGWDEGPANDALRRAADDAGAVYMETAPALDAHMASDGVHVRGPGYTALADRLRGALTTG